MNTTPQISPKDGHWYWVVYTPASGKAFDPAPACYRLEFDTWHSNLFSGVFSDLVTVLDEVIAPSATGEDPNALAHVWPCANIDLDEHGNITNGKMYAPGFPAGNHDVYPVRVPYMDEHTEAWRACVAELNKVSPGFLLRDGQNGIECAVAAIRDLADRTQSAQADHLPDSGNMIGAQAVAEPHPPTRHCMCADCLPSFDDTEALPTPKAEPAPIPKYQTPHDFKNFHRQLCARFGYVHDEQFWWRDLVSLIEHIASKAQPAVEPVAWREQFASQVYADLAAADNQDVPLEQYPARILKVLDSIVGPRHPTVVQWRNDAIRNCASIAYKYCRDPESANFLKQDLEALLTATPAPAPNALDAETAIKNCLEAGETMRVLKRVVNLLLESRRNLGPEDHELRDRIDQLFRPDAAIAAQSAQGG